MRDGRKRVHPVSNLTIDEAIARREEDSLAKNVNSAKIRDSRINDIRGLRNSSSREIKCGDENHMYHESEVQKVRITRDVEGESLATPDLSCRDSSTCTKHKIQRSDDVCVEDKEHTESNVLSRNIFVIRRNIAVNAFYDDSLNTMIAVVNDYHLSIDTNHAGTQIM